MLSLTSLLYLQSLVIYPCSLWRMNILNEGGTFCYTVFEIQRSCEKAGTLARLKSCVRSKSKSLVFYINTELFKTVQEIFTSRLQVCTYRYLIQIYKEKKKLTNKQTNEKSQFLPMLVDVKCISFVFLRRS